MNDRDPMDPRYPSRRDFLTLGIGAFVVASVPWAAARRRHAVIRRTIPVMGTVAEIAVVHPDARYAQAAIEAAFAELRAVERTMTRFRADSDVGRMNGRAGRGPVVVSAATADVLTRALRWAEASDGLFDPALLTAVALWDVGNRRAPPAPDQVRREAGRRLYRQVELDRRGGEHVVRLHEREMGIDLGGIAKGYAVDRAVDALRAWGIAHALVGAGGDLYALGHSPEGDAWEVGVQSPSEPGRLAATLSLRDEAVATSGDYQQFFDHSGRRYHHLLDPHTGEPRRSSTRSLTVAAQTCVAADAAATAVFGCAADRAIAIIAAAAPDARIVHQG